MATVSGNTTEKTAAAMFRLDTVSGHMVHSGISWVASSESENLLAAVVNIILKAD